MIDNGSIAFSSSLGEYFIQFLNERNLLGYKDEAFVRILKHFDRFCLNYDCADSLPKEVVLAWIKREAHWQSSSTQQHRITLVRKLADFMARQGLDAYRVPTTYWPKTKTKHVPYVFSHQEIEAFFKEIDSLPKTRFNEKRSDMQLLFRILYCCGLRVSEALKLRVQDVDMENGVLTIFNGKNSRDR